MSGIQKKKSDSGSIVDTIGTFYGRLFDILTKFFDTLERIFDVLEKAFDGLPLIRPLIVLAITGMLIYYVVFFKAFNARDMLLFIYFFVGGIVFLALIVLYKFAKLSEPYLLYRGATRKSREENRGMLETHQIMRQIIEKRSKHKEISANDVLVPPKDKKTKDEKTQAGPEGK